MTQLSKNEALKKLKEAKEQLELELITQEEYDKLKEEFKDVATSTLENEEDNQEDNVTDSSSNSLIKKYNSAEEDLYKVSYITNNYSDKSIVLFNILKPYKVSGGRNYGSLLDAIKNENYHNDQTLIDKYGEVNLESTGTSLWGEYIVMAASCIIALLIVYWVATNFLGIGGTGCVQKTHYLSGLTLKLKSGGKGSIEAFGDWKTLKWGFNDSETKVWITYMTSNGSKTHWYRVDGCDLKR
jgi:hypothetical protein